MDHPWGFMVVLAVSAVLVTLYFVAQARDSLRQGRGGALLPAAVWLAVGVVCLEFQVWLVCAAFGVLPDFSSVPSLAVTVQMIVVVAVLAVMVRERSWGWAGRLSPLGTGLLYVALLACLGFADPFLGGLVQWCLGR